MNTFKRTLVLTVFMCSISLAGDPAKPITITIEESKAFAFPALVLGTQEEVFTMPYLFNSQLEGYRKLGFTAFRYPCGCPSDWFAWDDIENGYWPSDFEKKRTKMTPDQFIEFCKAMKYTPIITVNTTLAGTHNERNRINPTSVESIRKGAAYAAKWVEHANIKNKAGVKYWEIGNETWIWMKEREYPVHVREYAKAMRKVDPSIKIIACGSTHEMEFQPVWLNFPEDKNWKPRTTNKVNPKRWTKALLTQARGFFDYLAPHIYTNGDSADPIENGKSLFANIDESERLIYEQIQWIKEEKSPVRLAQTEWMINWHFLPELKDTFKNMGTMSKENYDKVTYGNSPSDAFISLLGSADFLGKLIATGYVDIAVSHSMYYNLAIAWDAKAGKPVDPVVVKPAGVATQFWSQLKDQQFVPVRLADVPTYTYKNKKIPLLTAYATMSNNKLNVILINRSPDQSLQVAVPTTLKGKPAKSATEYAVVADSWAANVYPAVHDPSKYPFKNTTRPIPTMTLSNYELKPCKLIRLEIAF